MASTCHDARTRCRSKERPQRKGGEPGPFRIGQRPVGERTRLWFHRHNGSNASPVTAKSLSPLLYFRLERTRRLPPTRVGAGITTGESRVIGREYFLRQAAILFKVAKITKDPKISAALLEKAADLKLKVEQPGTPPDLTPQAPDVEPDAR